MRPACSSFENLLLLEGEQDDRYQQDRYEDNNDDDNATNRWLSI